MLPLKQVSVLNASFASIARSLSQLDVLQNESLDNIKKGLSAKIHNLLKADLSEDKQTMGRRYSEFFAIISHIKSLLHNLRVISGESIFKKTDYPELDKQVNSVLDILLSESDAVQQESTKTDRGTILPRQDNANQEYACAQEQNYYDNELLKIETRLDAANMLLNLDLDDSGVSSCKGALLKIVDDLLQLQDDTDKESRALQSKLREAYYLIYIINSRLFTTKYDKVASNDNILLPIDAERIDILNDVNILESENYIKLAYDIDADIFSPFRNKTPDITGTMSYKKYLHSKLCLLEVYLHRMKLVEAQMLIDEMFHDESHLDYEGGQFNIAMYFSASNVQRLQGNNKSAKIYA